MEHTNIYGASGKRPPSFGKIESEIEASQQASTKRLHTQTKTGFPIQLPTKKQPEGADLPVTTASFMAFLVPEKISVTQQKTDPAQQLQKTPTSVQSPTTAAQGVDSMAEFEPPMETLCLLGWRYSRSEIARLLKLPDTLTEGLSREMLTPSLEALGGYIRARNPRVMATLIFFDFANAESLERFSRWVNTDRVVGRWSCKSGTMETIAYDGHKFTYAEFARIKAQGPGEIIWPSFQAMYPNDKKVGRLHSAIIGGDAEVWKQLLTKGFVDPLALFQMRNDGRRRLNLKSLQLVKKREFYDIHPSQLKGLNLQLEASLRPQWRVTVSDPALARYSDVVLRDFIFGNEWWCKDYFPSVLRPVGRNVPPGSSVTKFFPDDHEACFVNKLLEGKRGFIRTLIERGFASRSQLTAFYNWAAANLLLKDAPYLLPESVTETLNMPRQPERIDLFAARPDANRQLGRDHVHAASDPDVDYALELARQVDLFDGFMDAK